MAKCNVRFMDNQKIESTNYTVTNEDGSFPFTNILSNVRSKTFRSTSNSAWRLTIDLGFQDKVNTLALFAPLGETLGITREATIKLQADNVSVWTSPDLSIDLSLTSDDRLIYFLDDTLELNYRFWSLYIDDPSNPNAYISFAYAYMGDYTTTALRNVSNGFRWTTNDRSRVSKSMDGTPYFDTKTKYDSFESLEYGYLLNNDRLLLEGLYDRVGISNWMPIALDPEGKTTAGDIEQLTRLARFSVPLNRNHKIAEYYSMSFSLEEVI